MCGLCGKPLREYTLISIDGNPVHTSCWIQYAEENLRD